MAEKETYYLKSNGDVIIKTIKVKEGTISYDGRVLLLYEENKKINKLKCKHVGTVNKIYVKEGDEIKSGTKLIDIDVGCSHPTVINDLCAECGADLRKEGQTLSNAIIPMIHSIPQLKVSHEQAQLLGKADTERLLSSKKLVLLVDLDQTLIHTTHDIIPNNIKDVYHFQLFSTQNPWYHTRLRPWTEQFLNEMTKIYELHICTFGVRPYAHTVARLLDKDGKLFSNRILSRDECFDYNSKHANLHALFPCGDELVCIIDDREDVWNYSQNVIPVKPYHFFKNTGDVNDPNLPPVIKYGTEEFAKTINHSEVDKLNEKKTEKEFEQKQQNFDKETEENFEQRKKFKVDESDTKELLTKLHKTTEIELVDDDDDYLLYLETILKNIHSKFYEIYEEQVKGIPDVKYVINLLRSSVLAGCELVFSGLIPLRECMEKSEPYIMARKLGATVVCQITENTTHLVAAHKGTAKFHKAKKSKIKAVNPYWLITCSHRWEKVNEKLYPVLDEKISSLPFRKGFYSKFRLEDVVDSGISLSRAEWGEMAKEVDEVELEDTDEEGINENIEIEEEQHFLCEYIDGDDNEGANGDEDWNQMGRQLEEELDDNSHDKEY